MAVRTDINFNELKRKLIEISDDSNGSRHWPPSVPRVFRFENTEAFIMAQRLLPTTDLQNERDSDFPLTPTVDILLARNGANQYQSVRNAARRAPRYNPIIDEVRNDEENW